MHIINRHFSVLHRATFQITYVIKFFFFNKILFNFKNNCLSSIGLSELTVVVKIYFNIQFVVQPHSSDIHRNPSRTIESRIF